MNLHPTNVLRKSLLFFCFATLLVLFSVSQAAAVPVTKYSFITFQTTSRPDGWPAIRDANGWTSNVGNKYTAVGFELDWVNYANVGVWKIKDADLPSVTGNGPFLDRYISTTIDPASWGWADWITTITHSFDDSILNVGEGFQIRTNLDNFAVPLVEIIGNTSPTIDTGTFAAGTDTTSSPGFAKYASSNHTDIYTTGTPVQVVDGPVELRYYYWDTVDPDGMGAGWAKGAAIGTTPWTLSAVSSGTIPDPGTVWLLGSGLIGLAAFRRKYTK